MKKGTEGCEKMTKQKEPKESETKATAVQKKMLSGSAAAERYKARFNKICK